MSEPFDVNRWLSDKETQIRLDGMAATAPRPIYGYVSAAELIGKLTNWVAKDGQLKLNIQKKNQSITVDLPDTPENRQRLSSISHQQMVLERFSLRTF